MKVNIGKNTLGDSDKMSVSLREYERSTHDLSFAWRSSMGIGTLVPCLKILAEPGDTFTIESAEKIMTHPTLGPLFGSYKFQMDVFTCPIRLYNAMLHNNALNIGLDMSKVKLPKLLLNSDAKTSNSSIFNYLGVKKFKKGKKVNAVPTLAIFDIFKNYYANKQEKDFYIINNEVETNSIYVWDEDQNQEGLLWAAQSISTGQTGSEYTFKVRTEIAPDAIVPANSTITFRCVDWVGEQNMEFIKGELTLSEAAVKLESINGELYVTIPNSAKFRWSETVNNDQGTIKVSGISLEANTGIRLEAIKLEEIDNLREEILSVKKQEYVIGEGGNCKIDFMNKLVTRVNSSGALYGLPLKTHFSDIFNNWVDKEWVDGDNGISAVTAIDTSGGSFTIDTLNLTEKVYNLLNRIAISGGDYKSWIQTVWTTDYYFRAETPVYEGGLSGEIEFSEVVSTSATEINNNEPLGSLGGKGYNSNPKGGTVTIKVSEPCYIIGLASITPRVDYSQGNDWDNDLDTLDDLHKPQLDGIGYQDLMQKWMHADANENAAVGKTVAWINYMTNYNKSYGNFAVGGSESYMCLNRIYTVGIDGEIENTTTYINPKEFTGTFATNELSNQDFWVQIGFRINARRVMSAKQIPIM
jgi:hypothetical protein